MSNPYEIIDQAYQSYISTHPELGERWLLIQTLYSGVQRRAMLGFLPIQAGMQVLDVGTGFGALAFDLASQTPISVEAIDVNEGELQIAREIRDTLIAKDCCPNSRINFAQANVYELPYANNSFDFAISRFVYQHLQDPLQASREILRVLRPGGVLCLMDIDDQFTLSYPEPSASFHTLQKAFQALQDARGGDRFVGRKLASYVHAAGFREITAVVQPQSQFAYTTQQDVSQQLTLERFRQVRENIVQRGILTSKEFDLALASLGNEASSWTFDSTGQMIVLARKPA